MSKIRYLLFILMLPWNSWGQQAFDPQEIYIPVAIVVSAYGSSGIQFAERSKKDGEVHFGISYPKVVTRVEIIDSETLLFEFPKVLSFELIERMTGKSEGVHIFRSFEMKVKPGTVENLLKLKNSPLVAIDIVPENIVRNTLEQFEEHGLDFLVKTYLNQRSVSRLMLAESLGIFIGAEDILRGHNHHLNQISLRGKLLSDPLSKNPHMDENGKLDIDIARVNSFVPFEASDLKEFIDLFEDIRERGKELDAKKWLNGLKIENNIGVVDDELARIDSNVIKLRPAVSCRQVFSGS